MTDAEKDALLWLESYASYQGVAFAREHARTLKALLAEPRLPTEPSRVLLATIRDAKNANVGGTDLYATERYIWSQIHAHLTAPKTKTVEVWRVEWVLGDFPMCHQHVSEADAHASAKLLREEAHRTCVHVTGPHTQTVPA